MKLTDRAYDVLKFVALVLLPGFSTAYFGLAQIWGFPNVEQVVGTGTTIDTFLGLLLKSSSSKTTDGQMVIVNDDAEGVHNIGFSFKDGVPTGKNTVRFDVVERKASASEPAE